MTFPIEIIPELVSLTVDVTRIILDRVAPDVDLDDDAWDQLGPKIRDLVTMAVSGQDISHEDLAQYIPSELRMRMLQTQKRIERIAAGLPV